MSAIVRTSKDVNIAEGDFARKLREALEEAPRGAELALRREMPEGVATTMTMSNGTLGAGVKWEVSQPALRSELTISFVSAATFSASLFGKAIIDNNEDPDLKLGGDYLSAEQVAEYAKKR